MCVIKINLNMYINVCTVHIPYFLPFQNLQLLLLHLISPSLERFSPRNLSGKKTGNQVARFLMLKTTTLPTSGFGLSFATLQWTMWEVISNLFAIYLYLDKRGENWNITTWHNNTDCQLITQTVVYLYYVMYYELLSLWVLQYNYNVDTSIQITCMSCWPLHLHLHTNYSHPSQM